MENSRTTSQLSGKTGALRKCLQNSKAIDGIGNVKRKEEKETHTSGTRCLSFFYFLK